MMDIADVNAIVAAMPIDEVDCDHDLLALYRDPSATQRVLSLLLDPFRGDDISAVVGTESRGFLIGGMAAALLGVGFVAVRKHGRYLPGKKYRTTSEPDWEGKQTTFEIQSTSLSIRDRVVVVDDWYTTGSQARATMGLIRETGASVVGAAVVVEEGTNATDGRLGKFHALLNWSPQQNVFTVSKYNRLSISPCCAAKEFQTEILRSSSV